MRRDPPKINIWRPLAWKTCDIIQFSILYSHIDITTEYYVRHYCILISTTLYHLVSLLLSYRDFLSTLYFWRIIRVQTLR